MEVRAITKYVKVQPRKVRIVADEVRGKSAVYTAHQLRFHRSKAAFHLRKTLISAIHNAVNNHGLPVEELKITKIMIDAGPRMKRIEQRAMGRAYRIEKKMSHITVVVDQAESVAPVKNTGTKPKPRPTFAAPKRKASGKKKDEAMQAEEATPVTASDAPEEQGSAAPETAPQAEAAGDEQEGKE